MTLICPEVDFANVVTEALALDPSDLTYSIGLFDYLSTQNAETVLASMLANIAPGGKVIIGNLLPLSPIDRI